MQKRKGQKTCGKFKNNRKVVFKMMYFPSVSHTVRLVRSSSTNHLPPLSPSFDSTTSHHEGAFSSFRSRHLSSASSTGPISPLHIDDLASHNFPLLTDTTKRGSDLDSFALNDLNLETDQSSSLDPANMLLHFLHPKNREMQSLSPSPHKITVSK